MAVSEKLRKKLEKKKKELDTKGQGFGYQTIDEGKHVFRFLNPGEDEDFAMEVEMFFLGKDGGSFISPATFGLPCAGYETYKELKSSKEEDEQEIAQKLKPRKMYLTAVLSFKDDRGKEPETDKGAQLLKIAGGTYSELIEWMLDEDYGDFTDPKNGYGIKITRTGKGQFDTKYTLKKLDNVKLPKELRGEVSLEEMIKKILPTYEETQEKINTFLGVSGDDDDDEPKKKKKKKGSKEEKSSKKSKDKSGKKKKKKTSDI